MKLLIKGLLLFTLGQLLNLSAQKVQIERSRLLNYETLKYIGSSPSFNFFWTQSDEEDYLIKIDKNDINKIQEIRVKLREPNILTALILDSNLLYITYNATLSKPQTTTSGLEYVEPILTGISFYKFDSYTNEPINHKHLDFKVQDISLDYAPSISVNFKYRYLSIGQNHYYNFNFEEIREKDFDTLTLDSNWLEPKFSLKTKLDEEKRSSVIIGQRDSKIQMFSAGDYEIYYKKLKNKSVVSFNSIIINFTILHIGKNKIDTSFLFLEENKTIIDFYATTTPDKSLLIFGKYREKKDDHITYGFFTVCYDISTGPIRKIVYSPFIIANSKKKDIFQHPLADAYFMDFRKGFEYELLGNHSQFFLFQFGDIKRKFVNSDLIAEDINALIIDSSGNVLYHAIPLFQNSTRLNYYRSLIVNNNDDFYLLYFDNENNMPYDENYQPEVCDLTTQKCTLVSQKLNLITSEIENKKIVFKCKEFGFIPFTTNMKKMDNKAHKNYNTYWSFWEGYLYQLTLE